MSLAAALKQLIPVAADGPDGEAVADAATPFHLRLRAWWGGSSLQQVVAEDARRVAERAARREAEAAAAADAPESVLDLVARDADPAAPGDVAGGYWSPARIAINEMLFGSGEILPGGAARTLDLIGAFGLGRDVNVLQIGAGLGGAARAIATEYQGWVTGFEADPALAAAAMAPERVDRVMESSSASKKQLNVKLKLADKARICHADLEHLELKTNVYDCAFAREVLHSLADKISLCDVVFNALKPHAPFMITDYFVAEGAGDSPQIKSWIEREPRAVHPWTLAEAKKLLIETGYDLRVVEDITAQFRGDIFRGFAGFVVAHERSGIAPNLIEPLLEFAELWGNRVAALDAGTVEVYKLVALRIDG